MAQHNLIIRRTGVAPCWNPQDLRISANERDGVFYAWCNQIRYLNAESESLEEAIAMVKAKIMNNFFRVEWSGAHDIHNGAVK